MLKFSIKEFFNYLCSLPPKKIQAELTALKWKQNPLKHKNYSNSTENVKGQLDALNAVGNEMRNLALFPNDGKFQTTIYQMLGIIFAIQRLHQQ